MDLYKILGIEKDATLEQVKKAYRQKAKESHPDAGGDAKEFEKISRAHVVLTDPAKRERYDATGETDTGPNNTQDAALQIIHSMLDKILSEPHEHFPQDLTKNMDGFLTTEIQGIKQEQAARKKLVKKAEMLKKRFSVKKGQNRIEAFYEWKIRQLNQQIGQMDSAIAQREAARAILKDYSFETDAFEQSVNSVYATQSMAGGFFRVG